MSITTIRAILLLTLSALTSCATQGIHVKVMRPAPVNLGQYGIVAVDDFTGEGNVEMAEKFALALRNARNPLTGKVDFEVIDRKELDDVLDSMRGRRGKRWDDEAATLLDEWRSAEVFLSGDIQSQIIDESLRENPWVDIEGLRHITYTRQCVASISLLIEVANTDGDRVFDRVTLQGTATGTTSAVDQEPATIENDFLFDQARDQIVQRYLRRIIPHEEFVLVQLYKDGSFPGLQIGNGYAQTGAWDRALESYRQTLELMNGDQAVFRYKALFNIGVGLEYTNQFTAAREALRDAYAFEQDSMILRELDNVGHREREFASLLDQGLQVAAPKR